MFDYVFSQILYITIPTWMHCWNDTVKRLLYLKVWHSIFVKLAFSIFPKMQVRMKIKVVTGTPSGAVAAEARWSGSHWVILDK